MQNLKVLHFFWQICAWWIFLVKEKQLLRYIVEAGQEIGSRATKYRWGVKKERVGRKKYMYIYPEIPWLLQVFRRLCLFVFPRFIHLTEQSARRPTQPRSPSPARSFLLSSTLSILRACYLPLRRASLSLIDFLRLDGVRGCDSNGCSFSRLSLLASNRLLALSLVGLSPPLPTSEPFPINQHPQSSRIFFFPLSRTTTRTRRRRGQRRKRRKRATGNVGSGRGRPEIAGRPRGKGMQDIAAPRDTRGRNLYDGAGDVLQSRRSSPTTKSLGTHAWMAHSPWLVSRKVSIYSDYSLSSQRTLPSPPLAPQTGTRHESISSQFLSPPPPSPLFHLSIYVPTRSRSLRNKDFIFHCALGTKMTGFERRRNASCVADFFHYDSLNHNPLRWLHYSTSNMWTLWRSHYIVNAEKSERNLAENSNELLINLFFSIFFINIFICYISYIYFKYTKRLNIFCHFEHVIVPTQVQHHKRREK